MKDGKGQELRRRRTEGAFSLVTWTSIVTLNATSTVSKTLSVIWSMTSIGFLI